MPPSCWRSPTSTGRSSAERASTPGSSRRSSPRRRNVEGMSAPPPLTSADLPLPSLALVVLDGWGLAPAGPGNAISLASTPVFDSLWQRYPHTELDASGAAVGLPPGQMGNSEV